MFAFQSLSLSLCRFVFPTGLPPPVCATFGKKVESFVVSDTCLVGKTIRLYFYLFFFLIEFVKMQANLQKCKVSSDDLPMQGSLIFFQTVEYGESREVLIKVQKSRFHFIQIFKFLSRIYSFQKL